MRKKNDQRRQAILDAAYEVFRTKGFEGASMSAIKAKSGGSRATLYSYFASKEELFVECFALAEPYLKDIFSSLYDPKLDLATTLQRLGERAIELMCSPELLSARRVAIAQAERSGVGKLFYEKIRSGQRELVGFFADAMHEGKLLQSDPVLATLHFRALLEAELFEPCALAARPVPPGKEDVKSAADRAVTAFLRAYAPQAC